MGVFFVGKPLLFRALAKAAAVLVFMLFSPSLRGQEPVSLQQEAYRSALDRTVLLRNQGGLLPLKRLDTLRIGLVQLGKGGAAVFKGVLEKYTLVNALSIPVGSAEKAVAALLAPYNLLVFCLQDGATAPPAGAEELLALQLAAGKKHVVFAVFDAAQNFRNLESASGANVLIAAPGDFYGQSLAAQLLFGGVSSAARLESEIGPAFPVGAGMNAPAPTRLGFAPPEVAGLNGQLLRDSIGAIIEAGMANMAYPGAQVLVAKDNKIVYHEVFGYHTYEGSKLVGEDDLYDFASVTKITSGLPVLMEWYGQGRFDPDAPLLRYLPETKGSNKADLSMRRILTHTARLMAWIPFWRGT